MSIYFLIDRVDIFEIKKIKLLDLCMEKQSRHLSKNILFYVFILKTKTQGNPTLPAFPIIPPKVTPVLASPVCSLHYVKLLSLSTNIST